MTSILAINEEIKKKYPQFEFDDLEKYILDYQKRYYKRLVSQKKRPNRLLGHNGTKFLLDALQRSRCLFEGFIDCVNNKHRVIAYLVTRAHYEVTGSVAYFFNYLNQFYDKKIQYSELDSVVYKLCLGGRTFPDKESHPQRPDSINVLTQIDAADKLYAKMGGKTNKPFRDIYDFLSEFCHPNWLGATIASDIERPGTVIYYERPEFKENDFGVLLNYMLMDCAFFFHVYDKCFSLLKKNEEIPNLMK